MDSFSSEFGTLPNMSEPTRVLPVIHLKDVTEPAIDAQQDGVLRHDMRITDADDHFIGLLILDKGLTLDSEGPSPQAAKIEDIVINNPAQGYGKAAYLELLRQLGDMPLISGNINALSTAVWKSLVRDGLAEERYVAVDGKKTMVGYISKPEAIKSWFATL